MFLFCFVFVIPQLKQGLPSSVSLQPAQTEAEKVRIEGGGGGGG